MNVNSELFELFDTVRKTVNSNDHLKHLGRYCSTEFLVQSGEQSVHLVIERGVITRLVQGPLCMRAWQFAFRAQPQAWQQFWEAVPAVGFNDIFAMSRYGHMDIDGDIGPLLEHQRYIKEVLAIPRQIMNKTTSDAGTRVTA